MISFENKYEWIEDLSPSKQRELMHCESLLLDARLHALRHYVLKPIAKRKNKKS